MKSKLRSATSTVLGISLLLAAGSAVADFSIYDEDDTKIDIQLNLIGAAFQGSDAWFGADEDFLGADVNNWAEQGLELGITGETSAFGGTFFGAASVVQTRTFSDDASGFTIGIEDPADINLEQGYIGWKSGEGLWGFDAEALTVKAGRLDYNIGTGLLINDGGGDGGKRGGWYLGMRKAFRTAFLASLDTGPMLVEAFYLENQPRHGGTTADVYGGNLEYEFDSIGLTLSGTYLEVEDQQRPTDFGDFNTVSVRASWQTPLQGLKFDGEVVEQGDNSDGEAYWLSGAYHWESSAWAPTLSYRYAHFSGDDPDTVQDERFRPIAYGFTDYGSWFQGEISGNYPLENSNLNSHLVRLQLSPTEEITLNVLYYNFTLDQKQIFGDPVSSTDWGDEINLAMDWAVSDKLYVIFTLSWLTPGQAAIDWTGGEDDWFNSMAYVSFSF